MFSRYDEFVPLMWGVDDARRTAKSGKLRTLFGSTEPVEPGRLYGAIDAGTARVFHDPPVTHPGDHISRAAIGYSLDWFARTLRGGAPRPAADQIWLWKEAGTGVALIGAFLLLLGTVRVLAGGTAPTAAPAVAPRRRRWTPWIAAALPALTFYPAFLLGAVAAPASKLLPQATTNQVLVWLAVNAALSLVLQRFAHRTPPDFAHRWARSAAFAAAAIAVVYGALWLADGVQVDFRFWVVALKLPSAEQLRIALVYAAPFTLCFAALFRGVLADADNAAKRRTQYAAALLAMSAGLLLMLLAVYGRLFATGGLPPFLDPLATVIAIQFVPLTAALAGLAVFTWRRTGGYALATLIAGPLITLYTVAGTATQVV